MKTCICCEKDPRIPDSKDKMYCGSCDKCRWLGECNDK